MNKRRINKLIKALKTEAAKNMFDMGDWGKAPKGAKSPIEAFKSGGECGTTACVAGVAAIIDPVYFKTQKLMEGDTTYYYWEIDKDSTQVGMFADWLGVSLDDADLITDPDSKLWNGFKKNDINHAINLLEAYRDGGMDKAMEVK